LYLFPYCSFIPFQISILLNKFTRNISSVNWTHAASVSDSTMLINDGTVNYFQIQWQGCKPESGEYSKYWETHPDFYSNQDNISSKGPYKCAWFFLLRHSVLAVFLDLKINIYGVEFSPLRSHTTSKWRPKYKIFCHMLLIQDKVNNTSTYLEFIRNSRTPSTSIRFS